jgi:hypothetical protein
LTTPSGPGLMPWPQSGGHLLVPPPQEDKQVTSRRGMPGATTAHGFRSDGEIRNVDEIWPNR